MAKSRIALNLKRLRLAAGLTQADLATAASLSRVAYRNIETGASDPRSETLQRLADALRVPIAELVEPYRHLEHVRFRSHSKPRCRDQILIEVARWLEDYRWLLNELGIDMGDPKANLPRRISKNPKKAAMQVRESLLDEGSPDCPIADIARLLESKGIKVKSMELGEGVFGLSVSSDDGGPAVIVNTAGSIPVERWIFSAAHELGHIVLHLSSFSVSKESEDSTEEDEANEFAAQFLMPDDAFKKKWKETGGLHFVDQVLRVKTHFNVSYKTVLYRLIEFGGADNSIWRLFPALYKERYHRRLGFRDEPAGASEARFYGGVPPTRKSQEPDHLPDSQRHEDRLAQLVRMALEDGKITASRASEILGISATELQDRAKLWARLKQAE